MREIPLTQGKVTLVDDADYEHLSQFKWHAQKDKYTWYAVRLAREGTSRKRMILMHRIITQAPYRVRVDHEDGDGLNNQRSNVRLATNSQNQANKRIASNNTSGYKGVSWNKQSGKWHSRIQVDGKKIHLGLFDDPWDAALAYNAEAMIRFGEFALLNLRRRQ